MRDLPAPPPDEKEIAFQVWAYLANRNAARTAKILAEPPGPDEQIERDPIHIPARTIRDWVRRYHWDEEADRRFREMAPGIHAHVVQQTILGSVQSIEYLKQLVTGATEADPKVRADAAKTILDRAGHLPWTRANDGALPSGPTRNYEESVAGKSHEELMKMLGLTPGDDE